MQKKKEIMWRIKKQGNFEAKKKATQVMLLDLIGKFLNLVMRGIRSLVRFDYVTCVSLSRDDFSSSILLEGKLRYDPSCLSVGCRLFSSSFFSKGKIKFWLNIYKGKIKYWFEYIPSGDTRYVFVFKIAKFVALTYINALKNSLSYLLLSC